MGKLLLLSIVLISGFLLMLLPDAALAQGWEGSGPISVGIKRCDFNSECLTGQYCFNFECASCPGSPGVCKQWQSGGGCTIVNQPDGTLCNGAGYFCNAGACVNCQSPGGACTSDANCCSGVKCDVSNSKCVTCDANKVQNNPAAQYGGGSCEAGCGASSQCDELTAGSFAASGKCTSQCLYYDGDVSQAACDAAVGTGNWNLGTGSEVAATTCCSDDAGEFNRFRDCALGACTDLPSDKKCCDSDTDCVFSGQCYYDVNAAIAGVVAENTGFCSGKKTQSACTSGESKVKCEWTGSSCVAAATRAAVQSSQKTGGTAFPSYADQAASPGQWRGASGSISGIVSNITDVVSGALVRVLGMNPPLTATTAADGTYSIGNVPTGDRDVAASKSGYEAKTNYAVPVYDGGTTTSDFVLVQALGDCEDDCTKAGSNLCDATCHGKGLCWFDSDATKQACDGTFGLTQMPGGQYVDCCMGKAYTPIKAEASVPAKNVIITKRPVLYKGKFVNMVIVVFNR
ncbi:carboxypeptidase regulatory-like domain-containing protein [Candidatus Woesearchaeota archaeon]|nr:carboxypeptidase regulatory-like domain-containing protein [Candidatus Woesearchaeota archaeon]